MKIREKEKKKKREKEKEKFSSIDLNVSYGSESDPSDECGLAHRFPFL